MASLEFDDIKSQFLYKVEAYDFISIDDRTVDNLMSNWLKSTASKPYIRRLFKSFVLDTDMESIEFEMRYSIEESADVFFINEIFALGMIVEWLSPKVWTMMNIAQRAGDKNEKWFSQAAHLKEMRALRDATQNEIRQLIADRGFGDNDYLDGAF